MVASPHLPIADKHIINRESSMYLNGLNLQPLRPLGALEKLFWLANQNRPTHFAMAAEIEGATSPEQWQQALAVIAKRLPVLAGSIVIDSQGQPGFLQRPDLSLPLDIVDGKSTRWTDTIAKHMALPFDSAKSGLLRVTLLHEARRATIVASVHHSVADALSLALIIQSLVRIVAGKSANLSFLANPVEYSVFAKGATVNIATHPTEDAEPVVAKLPLPYRQPSGTPTVTSLRLSEKQSKSLTLRARIEGVSVHAVLSAAVSMATGELDPELASHGLRVMSPIDVRRRLSIPTDAVGVVISGTVSEDCGPATSLWDRARHFSRQLDKSKNADGVAFAVNAIGGAMAEIDSVDNAAMLMKMGFGSEILLSNLGVLDWSTSYGPLTLSALWGPAMTLGFEGEQTVGVLTLGSRLHLLHTSYAPVAGLLDRVTSLLDAATGADQVKQTKAA
jgi:hypothetical protein